LAHCVQGRKTLIRVGPIPRGQARGGDRECPTRNVGWVWLGARVWLVTRAELHKLVDELPERAVEGAGVLLRGIMKGPIDPDQAWFWPPEWQAGEREADAQLRGRERNSLPQ